MKPDTKDDLIRAILIGLLVACGALSGALPAYHAGKRTGFDEGVTKTLENGVCIEGRIKLLTTNIRRGF